jgi:chorismate mutase
MNNNYTDIKNIELWALTETIDNWFIENAIEENDIELVGMAIRDIFATYPLSMFRILPNYSRLLVIKMLDYFEVLSLDNIHYVENELRNNPESYCNYDWFIEVTAREIRQKEQKHV